MKEVIKGLNKEKEILTTRLTSMSSKEYEYTAQRTSIERRLREIDTMILNLLKNNYDTKQN